MSRRLRRILSVSTPAFVAIGLLASVSAPAGAAVSPIPPNFDSSVMHGNEAEDAIAVNPADPSNIVTMATLPDVVSAWLYPLLQPAARFLIGVWLWRVSDTDREPSLSGYGS